MHISTSAPDAQQTAQPMHLVFISGMSGSGKSVALHALEDAGYYCVDNLPPELVLPLIEVQRTQNQQRLALAVDVRSAHSLSLMPAQIQVLRSSGNAVTTLFFDASDDTLQRRFSETRRKHPLTQVSSNDHNRDLHHAIARERELLADLRQASHVIDTSMTRASQLRSHVRQLIDMPQRQLTLIFESFGFKRGVPTDADYVFDVRMLPNPYYEPELRSLTGRDAPVAQYLDQQPAVQRMRAQITQFLDEWLDVLASDHRSYVTVAIGCTGGQHRSVYLVERLYDAFKDKWPCLRRHREQD